MLVQALNTEQMSGKSCCTSDVLGPEMPGPITADLQHGFANQWVYRTGVGVQPGADRRRR